MPDLIRKILALLSPAERRRAYLLLGMILIMAFLDMVGVASIMPFMAVLANPTVVETNPYLNAVYTRLNFTDPQAFLFFLGVVVFAALLVSIAFKALTTYANTRFTTMREYSIGRRLVSGYLHQPYAWFLNRHSADLGKTILSEVGQVVGGAIKPMMDLIAHGTVLVALLILLLLVDPLLALAVGGVLGLAYGLIYRFARGYLGRIGAERLQANQERFETLAEAFGGIKDVKVGGLEQAYTRRFERPAQRYARHQATAALIGALPRYLLEAIAFGGMLLVVLYLLGSDGGVQKALPIIAVYALAGYRMMPAIQLLYAAITRLRFAGTALDNLHSDILRPVVQAGFRWRDARPLSRSRAR
jgi:ATP-binding cassette, subfamily B, bacterial PglK